MNAVELKSHGWKLVLSAAVAVMSGLLIISVVLDLPSVPISTAFGGAPPSEPLERANCTGAAPEGEIWHGVDIELQQGGSPTVHVGSARLSAAPPNRPGAKIRWHSDLGIDAAILHTEAQSKVRRFNRERFDGAFGPPDDREVERLTLCYDLELTINTDANPSFTRSYEWSIEESVEPAQWQLRPGDSGVSTFEVSVVRDDGSEQGWSVSGTITIDNFTPSDAELEGIDNVIEGEVASQVDCGVDVKGYVLEAGESLRCDYRSKLPDASPRTVTAQVRTNGRVRGASGTSRIDFSKAQVREIGTSVYVMNNQGRAWTFHESGSSVYKRTFHCDRDAGLHPSAVRIAGTNLRSSTSVSVDCQPDKSNPTAARPEAH